ncbi:hypothetical protein V1460_28695 [Streptomyces sp. SCSIO 30461]
MGVIYGAADDCTWGFVPPAATAGATAAFTVTVVRRQALRATRPA